MTYRQYQEDLKREIRAAWAAGKRDVLAVLPTGGGKTKIFSDIVAEHVGASAAIAHRQELVAQMSLALARNGVRHRVIGPAAVARTCMAAHLGEMPTHYIDPSARCAVAGIDTLVRMDARDPWLRQVGLAVTDEAHHVLRENKWGKGLALFPNAIGLGVTATPVRADGRGLGRHADGLFDALVQGPGMRDLIRQGYLTDYRIFAPPSDLDLSSVPTSAGGDFSPEPLRKAVHKSHLTGDVVAHYVRIARGKLGVTFAVDIEAATELAQAYRDAGVPAEVVTSKTPDALRSAILKRYKARQVLQLVNVDLFGEGFDLPALEVVSMARPTQSYGLYCQQFGRSLRPLEGKSHAIVIDHVGNVIRHGLPDAYRTWSLDRRERRGKLEPSDAVPVRTCLNPECVAVYERVLPECPYCGHHPEPASRSGPEYVDGDLLELDEATLARLRGEVARVDAPPQFPQGVGPEVVGAIRKRHAARQLAQAGLRGAVALWSGWQRHQGRSDAEAYRRFYHRYGVDVATAAALGAGEAIALEERVRLDLNANGVVHAA